MTTEQTPRTTATLNDVLIAVQADSIRHMRATIKQLQATLRIVELQEKHTDCEAANADH